MGLSFDPIPNDIWEDWKWFVCPEGLLLGMREGHHRITDSNIVLTPCYIFNLPKLVMSNVMWASRLQQSADGQTDTREFLRPVHVDLDMLIEDLIFMLSQRPMVVKRAPGQETDLGKQLSDALESTEELVLVSHRSESETRLTMADLKVEFFNPFSEDAHRSDELIGVVPAQSCIKELTLAKADLPESLVRETLKVAIKELEQRGMITTNGNVILGMTVKGKAILDVEPLADMLSCRCEVLPEDEN